MGINHSKAGHWTISKQILEGSNTRLRDVVLFVFVNPSHAIFAKPDLAVDGSNSYLPVRSNSLPPTTSRVFFLKVWVS